MPDIEKIKELKSRIKGTLQKERLLTFTGGLLGTAGSILLVWIILSLIAAVVVLPVGVKITLLSLSAVISLYIFWRLSFRRLFGGNYEATALKLEKKFPELKGRLIAALQFSEMKKNIGYSEGLIAATLVQAAEKSKPLNFNEIISAYPILKNMRNTAIAGALGLLLLVIFPGFFSHSYMVYSNPTEVIAPPIGYELVNYPGNDVAIKYRDLDIGAVIRGDQFPDEAVIYYKFSEGIWQKTKIDLAMQTRFKASIGDSALFTTTLKQVRRSLDYYVRAGKVTTPVEHIDVVDRPRVTGIKMSIFYPKYTGLQPSVVDENDGTIAAVVGSRVNMAIQTNVPTKSAEMVFSDDSRSPFKIDGHTAEQSFRIETDQRYHIELLDEQNEVNPDPIEYQITAVPDEYPEIEVLRPGVDVNLTDQMLLPLLVHISDDYGFSSLVLKYTIVHERGPGEENIAVLHFSDRIKTEGEVNFNWDIEPLGLMPSEYIKYHFEIADNDAINGPKVTASRQYIARLPSLEEIIAQTDAEYGENIDRTEKYLRQQKELSERLKNIARKMEQDRAKGDQQLNWQHKKEIEDIVDKDDKISEQIKKTAENIDDMIDKMQENRTASRELLEKLAEIQKLFQEVATPEMKEARLRLMEALKNMDQQELQKALQDYQMTQEDMMKRLDRTIALLKKMKIEQKVNAMTEMARELAEKQEKVNKDTENSSKEGLPKLSPEEEKIKEGLEQLKQEAKKLEEMVKETPFQKDKEANEMAQAVMKCDAGQNMKSMSEFLKQEQKENAKSEGKQSHSKLMELLDQLQQQQAKICQGGGENAAKLIRDAIEDINYVSNNQESLINEAAMIRGQSEALRDIAGEQVMLQEMVRTLSQRIEDIGKESPFVAAELNNLMRNSFNNMGLSIDKLSDRRGYDATKYQKEAMFNLNRAAVRMLDALEKQSNCNKGGSCNKPNQKMQSLCQQQQKLNQQTQQQCNNPNSQSPPSPDALRRLAAEQGKLGKSLRQLQDEFGNSKEVLGRLEAIADDMEKVADQLANGEVGEETMNRQLKIYSRMLDATRTLQRKDFTDQRKAETGEDILRSSPPALSGNQLQGGLDIEDRLKKFLDEGYPPEYEEHIKAYFKALMEQLEPQSE